MSAAKAIRAALRAKLLTVGTLPAARAWENKGFVPVHGVPYVVENQISAARRPASTGMIEQSGIYQVTLVVPADSGVMAGEDIIDAILAAFAPATDCSGVCTIDRSEPNPPRQDGVWFRMPVSVRWRAYAFY
jgi:hypothetical protein